MEIKVKQFIQEDMLEFDNTPDSCNYYVDCNFATNQDSTCYTAVNMFMKALEVEGGGYTPRTIVECMLDCALNYAEANHIDCEHILKEWI